MKKIFFRTSLRAFCILIASLLLLSCEGEDQRHAPEPSPSVKQQVQYSLSYSAEANGSIAGSVLQQVPRGTDGSEVVAVADEGYHFTTWSDGVTTAKRIDRKVLVDLGLVAGFSTNQYTLTYTAEGNGSITGTEEQVVEHGKSGASVTAVPAENHHFTEWSDGLGNAVRTDHEVVADIAVTANFAVDQYTLNYTAESNGTIAGSRVQKVDYGHSGSSVTAVPADGFHFVSWSDGVPDVERTDRDVTTDLEVTASFSVNRYILTYSAGDSGSIEGPESQQVDHGGDGREIIAVPEKGYHFVTWSDGVTTDRRTDREVSADLTASAVFAVNTYLVSGNVSGLVEGTRLVLQINDGDDLIVTGDGRFEFSDQLLDGDAYVVSVLSQPVSPNQVCTATGANGTVNGENVTDVAVSCELRTYTVGGTISALPSGDRVVLQNNGEDDLTIEANGAFSFARSLEDGSLYEVKVSTPPERPNWDCKVNDAAGTLSGKDVTDIAVDCYVKAVLQADPGIRMVKLSWNSHDFDDVTFNLCRAREEMAFDESGKCKDFKDGESETKISSPHVTYGLKNDLPYWFQLEVKHSDNRRSYSNVIKSMAYGGLNDSGIDWCANDVGNLNTDGMRMDKIESCNKVAETHPGQDAFHGRDAQGLVRSLVKLGNGSAGFDFTRVCRNGKAAGKRKCPSNPSPGTGPTNWGCTRDNVTGLTWEVKTNSGLQGLGNTFSWYNPDDSSNGGNPGSENGGKCEIGACDTRSYVQAVNELGICGISDWRLPTRKELLSIVDNSNFKPAVDPQFFPNTVSGYYWTSTPYAEDDASAWQVYLLYGETYPDEKNNGRHVRLVAGKTKTFGFENP